jgi:hypothetical protein
MILRKHKRPGTNRLMTNDACFSTMTSRITVYSSSRAASMLCLQIRACNSSLGEPASRGKSGDVDTYVFRTKHLSSESQASLCLCTARKSLRKPLSDQAQRSNLTP